MERIEICGKMKIRLSSRQAAERYHASKASPNGAILRCRQLQLWTRGASLRLWAKTEWQPLVPSCPWHVLVDQKNFLIGDLGLSRAGNFSKIISFQLLVAYHCSYCSYCNTWFKYPQPFEMAHPRGFNGTSLTIPLEPLEVEVQGQKTHRAHPGLGWPGGQRRNHGGIISSFHSWWFREAFQRYFYLRLLNFYLDHYSTQDPIDSRNRLEFG